MKNFTSLTDAFSLFLIISLFSLSFSQETTKTSGGAIVDQPNAPPMHKVSPLSSFGEAISSIIVSELGDKTFFTAAILAMQYNRVAVFAGAYSALFLMAVIGTLFGLFFAGLLSPVATKILVSATFLFFGVKLLYNAYYMKHTKRNELETKELETKVLEIELVSINPKVLESFQQKKLKKRGFKDRIKLEEGLLAKNEKQVQANEKKSKKVWLIDVCKKSIQPKAAQSIKINKAFWRAFSLTFIGEWGDRSQVATIALATQSNAFAVFVGTAIGYLVCTSLAVIGGKMLADKISEKTINICGGVLFLIFAIYNIFWS